MRCQEQNLIYQNKTLYSSHYWFKGGSIIQLVNKIGNYRDKNWYFNKLCRRISRLNKKYLRYKFIISLFLKYFSHPIYEKNSDHFKELLFKGSVWETRLNTKFKKEVFKMKKCNFPLNKFIKSYDIAESASFL